MGKHLPDAVRRHARERGHARALACEGRVLSYSEFDSRTNRLARALLAQAPAGSRIGSLTRTRIEPGEVLLACAKAGLVAVPLNWRLAVPELVAVAQNAELKILVAEPDFLPAALAVRDAVPGLLLVVTGTEPAGDVAAYEPWLAAHPDDDPGRGSDADVDEVTLQLYTSGTTGLPKGVLITHRNLYSDQETLDEYLWDGESVSFDAMPMFHIGGCGWLINALCAGAFTIMLPDFAPETAVEVMEREGVTHAFFVPAVLQMVTALPGIEARDFSRLRLVVYGASPITPALLRRSMTVFGCSFMQKYGLTETVGNVARLLPHEHDPDGDRQYLLQSTGRPKPDVEVMVVDPVTGEPAPAGMVGEIYTRSRHNTPGYWKRPEETDALYAADGWLRTGDAGHLDTDGYLYVTDRMKDMVITGGENVYPIEVESVLAEHPAIADVAVIGVPHEKWGEEVTAVVVPRQGVPVPTESELIDFTRERIASYKKPRRVHFVDALPRNPSGKILKRELRAGIRND
ncbi:long-chain-fatty-acid--CoA ligase [Streptomyces sp. NPDC051940]|uniref:long-chain-fatty-acid--CoA ligase n=1 Tax=Streptomyces sp. NPDC051940 TaxID=3155675 RepID=UPI003413411D